MITAPEVVQELPPSGVAKRPVPAIVPETVQTTLPPAPAIAVLLSSRAPAYEDVARALERHFRDFEIYDLSDKSQPPVTAFRIINDGQATAVVAIGMRAARSAVAMSTSPVVFSQVFNARENGLLTDSSRGIAAVPPLDLQLREWKKISPDLTRVGLIVGEGHEDLVTEAELAAQKYDVELIVRTTHSDQETLYVFRRLVRNIDGFWLIPDNRILSSRVLADILTESRRHGVEAAVPTETMLGMGGAISMSSVAADVAARIYDVVRQIQLRGIASVASITPLSETSTRKNDAVLNRRVIAGARK